MTSGAALLVVRRGDFNVFNLIRVCVYVCVCEACTKLLPRDAIRLAGECCIAHRQDPMWQWEHESPFWRMPLVIPRYRSFDTTIEFHFLMCFCTHSAFDFPSYFKWVTSILLPYFFFPLVIARLAYLVLCRMTHALMFYYCKNVHNTNLHALNCKRQITLNKDAIVYLYF